MTLRPRILLLGASGQVGGEVARLLADRAELIAPPRGSLDLAEADAVRRAVRDARAAAIVNAAAYTAVDRAESEPTLAAAINTTAPGVLADEAARAGALLIHYSTDYVFDGTAREPYAEDAPTGPLGVYGRTKRDGERAVLAAGGRAIVLRTSWVYAPRGTNFLLTMRRLFREREEVRVVTDQHGAPTTARCLALATARVIEAAPGPALSGIYHVTARGRTTWHGFAEAIHRGLTARGETLRCRSVVPITTAEYPTPARRPAFSLLDCGKLERTFGFVAGVWEKQLEETLDELGRGLRAAEAVEP